jgi:hypothetical protein
VLVVPGAVVDVVVDVADDDVGACARVDVVVLA